ncbi:MAG: hypothetical protein ACK40H_06540 [Sphingomonadaceae bacterium]
MLTDGRDWNVYLPAEQGSYDDRRVHRLLIDERPVADCIRVLRRYLEAGRVRSGAAHEEARRDYRDAMRRRLAQQALPRAWGELLAGPEELLVELLADRAEGLCGSRPDAEAVAAFLRERAGPGGAAGPRGAPNGASGRPSAPVAPASPAPAPSPATPGHAKDRPAGAGAPDLPGTGRAVRWTIAGEQRESPNAGAAMVEILRLLVARDPSPLPRLAEAVRGRTRNHIARTPAEVYPERPDIARCAEISAGWVVGMNIANREKRRILLAAVALAFATLPVAPAPAQHDGQFGIHEESAGAKGGNPNQL